MIADHQVAFFLREIGADDPARRAAAAKGLGRVPGRAAELAALTQDPAPQVRAAAAQGLGRQGEQAPVDPLVALCSDPDAEVRRRAANVLDRLGASGPEVAAAFARLAGDAELRNRLLVLTWLRRAEVPVPPGTLTPLLADPGADAGLWAAAASLLRLLPEADAAFADLVRTAPAEPRRRALDMLAAPQAGIPGIGPDSEPAAREAAWLRLWTPNPRVVQALLAAFDAETEPPARNILFRALAAHRVPEAVAPAAAWLADPDCGSSAAMALGQAGTAEAVELLRRSVRKPAAACALGAAGGVPDAELLLGLLDDPDEPVRLGAVDGLGAFFQRFDSPLRSRLERWRAERVPGVPEPPAADDPALRALANQTAERLTLLLTQDTEHADAYHDALWHLPEVRPLLPTLLQNPAGKVRSTALHLAERFGEVGFTARLRLLEDPYHAVRQGAAMGFLQLAKQRKLTPDEQEALRPHLEHAQDDPDHYVRTFTATALEHLDQAP
ncbi:HEAT repeat domain-containing protein [Actinomadura macrotermitis]|uniref:HEAT repeat domain-containing protein n=1 Tax=Actinomadura macrotermitis TaxID=2585200 RepID=A0A7K0BQI0_9ACTN|nr:HEAT repeat domain-containing protein [Actinomadura macrotermitis]MQY03435.1 hypothetical protein [Actinomadura macrotermitis]